MQLSDRRRSRLGPAGQGSDTPGFFLHATIAVDVADEAVLGVVDAAIWTRPAAPAEDRRKRVFADKESHRWLAATEAAGSVLAAALQIVVVGDRESDIYQVFDGRPPNVELAVRVAQNRNLTDGSKLFDPSQPCMAHHVAWCAHQSPSGGLCCSAPYGASPRCAACPLRTPPCHRPCLRG